MPEKGPTPPGAETYGDRWGQFYKNIQDRIVASETLKPDGKPISATDRLDCVKRKGIKALGESARDVIPTEESMTYSAARDAILEYFQSVSEALNAGKTNPQFLENLRPYIEDVAEATGLQGKKLKKLTEQLNNDEKINAELQRIIEISKSKIGETITRRINSFLEDLDREMDQGLVLFTDEKEIQILLTKTIRLVCKDSVACDENFTNEILEAFKNQIMKKIERGREITFNQIWENTVNTTLLDDIDTFLEKIKENLKQENGEKTKAFLDLLERKLSKKSILMAVTEALVGTVKNAEVAEWLRQLLNLDTTADISLELQRRQQIIELTFPEPQQRTLKWVVEKIGERYGENVRKKITQAAEGETQKTEQKIIAHGSLILLATDQPEFRKLKYVEGDLTTQTPLEHFKHLEYVGGTLKLLAETKLRKLRYVGGNLLHGDMIHELGNLEYVGGNLNLGKTDITSLGKLKSVGGNLNIVDSKIEDLGCLRRVGGSFDARQTSVRSLGLLESVGKDLDIRHNPIENLGRLESVGGKIFCSKDSKVLEKLIEKFGKDKVHTTRIRQVTDRHDFRMK